MVPYNSSFGNVVILALTNKNIKGKDKNVKIKIKKF
jgi:hypothetical protein